MNKIFKIYISFSVCISTLSVLCTTSTAKDIVVENEYLVLKNNLEQAQSKFYLQENAKTINDIMDAEDAINNYRNYDGSDYYSILAFSTVIAKVK